MFTNELFQNSVKSLEGRILDGWVKAETKEGQLYYLNHEHRISQWDHPEYIKMMKDISVINSVRYAAYRTAFKLRHLQTRLKIHEVPLECISLVFNKAGYLPEKNTNSISIKEIERIILSCYKTSCNHKPADPHLCADLMLNMLVSAFDERRNGKIQVLKCKVFLTVMGGGKLQEKYKYLFNEISDKDNHVSRKRLAKLLLILSSIMELVSEELSFGSSFVPAAIESCFKNVSEDMRITENVFLDWVLQEPQTLVWWSTLYRISMAELVCHDVRCSTCKESPIIGMRYQCLKCLGYNLCQDCFLHGRTSKNHKPFHPLQEYCQESTSGEWGKSLLKIMYYRLLSGNMVIKPRYLTISACEKTLDSLLKNPNNESFASEVIELKNTDLPYERDVSNTFDQHQTSIEITAFLTAENLNNESNGSSKLLANSIQSSPSDELHSVIRHLEEGEEKLSNKIFDCGDSDKMVPADLLEQHREELQTQINRLKNILYNQVQFPKTSSAKILRTKRTILPRLESTPLTNHGLHINLSPIESHSQNYVENEEIGSNNKNGKSLNISSPSFYSPANSFKSDEEEISMSTFTPRHSAGEFFVDEENSEKASFNPVLSLSDLNFNKNNSSNNKEIASCSSKQAEDLISEGDNFTPTLKKSSAEGSDDLSKDFADIEEELQQLLRQIDMIFENSPAEKPIIDSNVVSGISEAANSLIVSNDTYHPKVEDV